MASSLRATNSASGVFARPPAAMLPMLMTGRDRRRWSCGRRE
jgi:hypothetical protein